MLDCVGEYGALAYVPIDVYLNAVRVAHDLAGGRREHGEALMNAARNNHTATVTALAGTHGANVDAVNRDGRTALMRAANNGHTDTVNALARTHGAKVDAVDRWGKTALMLATEIRHTATVNALKGFT